MTEAPESPRLGIVERLAELVRSLTLQNVLTVALLAVVAWPSWFAWKFLNDEQFRHDFMSSYKVVDGQVPCSVLISSTVGTSDRYSVGVVYDVRGRLEHLVVLRAPGLLSDSELVSVCDRAQAQAQLMREMLAEQARDEQEAQGKLKP